MENVVLGAELAQTFHMRRWTSLGSFHRDRDVHFMRRIERSLYEEGALKAAVGFEHIFGNFWNNNKADLIHEQQQWRPEYKSLAL